MRTVLLAIISLAATPAAGDFSLAFPLDCTLGKSCFIQNFVDQDPSSAARDFSCGSLTYDAHSGTDFALPDLAAQARGVNILAAADGTVLGARDGMADILQTAPDAPDIYDRDCGNGLVIAHEDGFETQYCHMTEGSLAVKTGQFVQVGDVLGAVGLSGNTDFPHLHITLRKDGRVVDPFDTNGTATCPDLDQPTLWQTPLPTPAGGIINIGVAEAIPSLDAVIEGTANTGAIANGAAIVGWVQLFGTRDGDILSIDIISPDGPFFSQSETFKRPQARSIRAGGRKTPPQGWPKGDYFFNFILTRGETIIDTASQTYALD